MAKSGAERELAPTVLRSRRCLGADNPTNSTLAAQQYSFLMVIAEDIRVTLLQKDIIPSCIHLFIETRCI